MGYKSLTIVSLTLALLYLSQTDACGCQKRKQKTKPTPYRSRACDGNLPCYKYLLNYALDGPFILKTPASDAILTKHYGLIDRNGRARAISEGRRAIEFFRKKYGFDFSYLTDNQILSGGATNTQGVSFLPYYTEPSSRYRLYSGAAHNEIQLFNRQASDGGFELVFSQDTQTGGTYQRMIPAGAITFSGSYFVLPCDPNSYEPCRNILNPDDPYAPVAVFFTQIDYIEIYTEPSTYKFLNVDAYSPTLGSGKARGVVIKRDSNNPNDPTFDATVTFTFPEYL